MRREQDHKWIFDLISGLYDDEDEIVYIENEDWILSEDIHTGQDIRYLVVFKDTSLHTIRNLTSDHIPMLMQVQRQCKMFINKHHDTTGWKLHFNYMPSTLQLHLHLSKPTSYNTPRAQPLSCVIRNLRLDSNYYRDSLIICTDMPSKQKQPKNRNFPRPLYIK